FIPFVGSTHGYCYNLQEGNYWTAGFYAGMVVLDATMLNSLAKAGGTLALNGVERLVVDEAATVVPKISGISAEAAAQSAAATAGAVQGAAGTSTVVRGFGDICSHSPVPQS